MKRPRRALATAAATALISVLPGLVTLPAAAAGPVPQAAGTPPPARPHPHKPAVTVTFRTVPAVAGIHLSFAGQTLVTDATGTAVYTTVSGPERPKLQLLDTSVDTPDRHYRFVRWAGQRDPNAAYQPVVDGLPLRGDYTVTAGFTVQYPVSAKFTDQHGQPLDTNQISAVKVKAPDGRALDLPPTGTSWLDGNQITLRGSHLESNPVGYSLQSLVYDGAQLADAGRQRFRPDAGSTVTFASPFHDLTVVGHGTLFGRAAGSDARVTGPDGKVVQVPLGPDHSATLTHLPRGRYTVQIGAPGGISATRSIQLSRSTTAEVPVVSGFDALTIGGLSLVVIVVIVVPLVVYLRRRETPVIRKAERPAAGKVGSP